MRVCAAAHQEANPAIQAARPPARADASGPPTGPAQPTKPERPDRTTTPHRHVNAFCQPARGGQDGGTTADALEAR
jgi:hypothetical protein